MVVSEGLTCSGKNGISDGVLHSVFYRTIEETSGEISDGLIGGIFEGICNGSNDGISLSDTEETDNRLIKGTSGVIHEG